jgi:hypothetical protein
MNPATTSQIITQRNRKWFRAPDIVKGFKKYLSCYRSANCRATPQPGPVREAGGVYRRHDQDNGELPLLQPARCAHRQDR